VTAVSSRPAFEFAGFRFELQSGLSRGGRTIRLAPTPSRVLAVLLAAQGGFVARDAVVRAGWRGREASDDSVSRCIYVLRRALVHPDGIEIVETAYGRGFRIAVPVARSDEGRAVTSMRKLVEVRHPAAFETWTVARELAARRTPSDYVDAIRVLETGLAATPDYAPSWALLAYLRITQVNHGWIGSIEGARLAHAAIERALALDPQSTEAYATRGFVRVAFEWNVRGGLDDLRHALELDPQQWRAHQLHAWSLCLLGRPRDALAAARLCAALNPQSPVAGGILATAHLLGDEPARILPELRALAARPGANGLSRLLKAVAESSAGEHEAALVSIEDAVIADPGSVLLATERANLLASAGRADAARAAFAALDAEWPGTLPEVRAPGLLALGDREGAIRALRTGRERRALLHGLLPLDPRLRELAKDPALANAWIELRRC
jgi:DNA-binding winged helix-turn-helix (wHTH) protein